MPPNRSRRNNKRYYHHVVQPPHQEYDDPFLPVDEGEQDPFPRDSFAASVHGNPRDPRVQDSRPNPKANPTHVPNGPKPKPPPPPPGSVSYQIDVEGSGAQKRAATNESGVSWEPVLKARKHVKNGRIRKLRKDKAYTAITDLECVYCDIRFRNPYEKAAHDRSRDHIRSVDRFRAEEQYEQPPPRPIHSSQPFPSRNSVPAARSSQDPFSDQASVPQDASGTDNTRMSRQPPVVDLVGVSGPSISQSVTISATERQQKIDKVIAEGLAILKKEKGSITIPDSFRVWAERSTEAIQTKISNGDASETHLALVTKEISYHLATHVVGCSLLKFDWSGREIATGALMKRRSVTTRVYTLEEIARMEEIQQQTAEKVVQKKEEDTPIEEEPSDAQPRKRANNGAQSNIEGRERLQSSAPPTGSAVKEEGRSVKVRSQWRPRRRCARTEQLVQMGANIPHYVRQKFYQKGPPPREEPSGLTVKEKRHAIKGLLNKFCVLAKSFNDEQASFEVTWDGLRSIVDDMQKLGGYVHCVYPLKEMVEMAIECRKYELIREPCRELNMIYSQFGTSNSSDSNDESFVAYFILCLLFKGAAHTQKKYARQGTSDSLELASLLRSLPKTCRTSIVVEALEAFKNIVSNNWVRFYRYFNDWFIHSFTECRTRVLCVPLVDFIRERALLTMFRAGKGGTRPFLQAVPMDTVMTILSYRARDEDDDGDRPLQDAKSFFDNLPERYDMQWNLPGRTMTVEVYDEVGFIRDHDLVNTPLVLAKNGDTMKLKQVR